jgi:HEAT repeat protein
VKVFGIAAFLAALSRSWAFSRVLVLGVALLPVLVRPAAAEEERAPVSRRSMPKLLEALAHPNPALRIEAVDEIGRRGDPRALIPLLKLLRDEVGDVRSHAAEALRVLGDERAVPFLSRALEDSDATVRCRALLALGDLAGKYVLPTVHRMLSDPSVVVRAAAVRALGEIGDPLSVRRIVSAVREGEDSPDRAVAAAAVIACTKISGAQGLALALEAVEESLPESWFLRASVAHAVGLAGDRERVPLLIEYLTRDGTPRVCQAAAGALAGLGAEKELLGVASHPDAFRRQAAVGALGRMDGPEARAALHAATRDESPGVVLSAAAVLVEGGEVEALPILIGLLEADAQVWLGALEILEIRTGRDYGRNPPRWREWFRAYRDRLVFDPESGTFREGR